MKFIEQHFYDPSCAQKSQHRIARSGKCVKATETTFLFVNSKKGETPPQSRQSLRSHVMQQARSKRKWSTSKGAINAAEPSRTRRTSSSMPAEQALIPFKEPIVAEESDQSSKSTPSTETPTEMPAVAAKSAPLSSSDATAHSSTVSTPAISHLGQTLDDYDLLGKDWFFLDPYASLPVNLDAASRGMLDQYLSRLSECFTCRGRTQCSISHSWFVAAFASRAFMYSLLCAAATHLHALGRIQYDVILQHESYAVKELASTLSDPILGVTDGNIAAVFNLMCVDEACLTSHEAQSSDQGSLIIRPPRKRVHSEGLKQMIRVRGGLLKLRHTPCLFSFLLWHATEHSVASFQPSPFFPCFDELATMLEQFGLSSRKADSPKRLARLLLASGSPHRLVAAARNTILLSRQYEAWLAEDPKAPSYTDMGDFSGLLVQSLLRFLHSQIEFDPMSEAIATALVMFVVRKPSDALPLFDPLHFAATKWLQHGLRCAPDPDWDPDVRLWVTTIGAICARGSSEALEIENAFVWACQAWDVRTLEQLLDALKGVLWIQLRFDRGAEQLWELWKDRILEH